MVATIAAPQTTASTQMAKIQKTFFDRALLRRGKYALRHREFGMKKSVPKGYKTLEVRRWNRILVSAIPETRYAVNTAASYATTPPTGGYIMDEGQNPVDSAGTPLPVAAATNFTIDQLTATPAQYGAYYPGTELLLQTSYDSVRAEVGDLLGQHSGEVLDRVCRNQIISYIAASGTTIYAGAATSEATIAATHLPTFAEFVEAVKILYRNEAEPCKNGRFCAIISPETWASVMLDATFQNAVIHGGKDTMFTGGWVGTLPWVGIDFYLVKGDGAKRENGTIVGTNGVHNTLIFGADAYAVLDWASMNLETIWKEPGSSGTNDPFNMRWTLAWKAAHVVLGLNGAWMVNLKHAVSIP
jgi:N4-gp56 family major capsid protein